MPYAKVISQHKGANRATRRLADKMERLEPSRKRAKRLADGIQKAKQAKLEAEKRRREAAVLRREARIERQKRIAKLINADIAYHIRIGWREVKLKGKVTENVQEQDFTVSGVVAKMLDLLDVHDTRVK